MTRGCSKGKTSARRRLPLESSPVASGMGEIPCPGASGIPRRPVPMNLDPLTTPQPKVPPPPMLYKEGDTFSSVLDKYRGWKGSRLTPRKHELLYYTMFYHDEDDSDDEKGDEKDVSKRMGIEDASEILQESGVIGEISGVAKKSGDKDESVAVKDAQVMGEGSEGVGEGSGGVGEGSGGVGERSEGVGEASVEGKHRHVPHKESIEARKDAYVSEKGEGSVGGDGSEGVLEARVGRKVSVGGTTVHTIEEIEGSVGGRGGVRKSL